MQTAEKMQEQAQSEWQQGQEGSHYIDLRADISPNGECTVTFLSDPEKTFTYGSEIEAQEAIGSLFEQGKQQGS